jgi:thiamine-monophosphate kinase
MTMLGEKKLISLISEHLPSSPERKSAPFSHDAEICRFGESTLLFTMDEFSGEDHFPMSNPFCLGWNITAGAISDIIATGGKPLHYAHALTVGKTWDKHYIQKFCAGVRKVLEHYGGAFIGGDIGSSSVFRCTASVIGKPFERIIGRIGAGAGDLLYSTGRIGAGNVNAAINLYRSNIHPFLATLSVSRFHLLGDYISLVNRFATACIDTSDGFYNAVTTLADLNNLGYRIDTTPFCKRGTAVAHILRQPELLLFFGECGEYELLFTVHPDQERDLLIEAGKQRCALYPLGTMKRNVLQRDLCNKSGIIDVSRFRFSARDYNNIKQYLKEVTQWIETAENGLL